MTDLEKQEVLKASLINIGRLLPPGTEIHFFREAGDPRARMQLCSADGTNTDYAFVGHGPIFNVPTVEASSPHPNPLPQAGEGENEEGHYV